MKYSAINKKIIVIWSMFLFIGICSGGTELYFYKTKKQIVNHYYKYFDVLHGIFLCALFISCAIWIAYFTLWLIGYMGRKRQEELNEKADKKYSIEFAEKYGVAIKDYNFYKDCEKYGIKGINSKSDEARFKMYYENHKEAYESVEKATKAFEAGKKVAAIIEEEQKQEELDKKLSELRKKESAKKSEYNKYKDLIGQEKRIKICKDYVNYFKSAIDDLEKKQRSTMDTMNRLGTSCIQKEKDWALHGGIASGIAGGAAGLAVASDIQRQNAEIREQNKKVTETIGRLMADLTIGFFEKKENIEEVCKIWERRLYLSDKLLAEQLPEKELLKMINPQITSLNISETGAVNINIKTQKTFLTIYDDVKAVVDGTIKINIMNKSKKVGEAFATLPYDGSASDNEIRGICTDISEKADNYTVEFEPYHLWAIEYKE